MVMEKNTHVLVKSPEISLRYLADYMASSERARRSLESSLKYRPIARLVQHKEAKLIITSHLVDGKADAHELKEKSEYIRNKLADDDFDLIVNEANAGYVERVSQIIGDLNLPNANLAFAPKFDPIEINGVKVRFNPQIALDRITKTNKPRRGALIFRYAKGKALKPSIAKFQSAAIYGVLREVAGKDDARDVERGLCLTVDAYEGKVHEAAGDAATDYANMRALLLTLAERWPAIKPPTNAVI
jgi:hypothetical protein